MTSADSSTNSPQPNEKAVKFFDRKGKLNQLAGLFSVLNLKKESDNQLRTREAENEYVRTRVFGAKPSSESEDDMATTVVFGDMIHQQPSPPPEKPGMGTLGKLGVAAALVASGVGAGAAVPLVIDALKPAPAINTTTTDTIERDYSIGDVQIEAGPAE